MPKVSVIVAVYNVEPYLKRSMDCLMNQTLSDLEFICIDDCSTDNSLAILKEYAAKDDRFKIIASQKNGGAAVARNKGLDVAVGEYMGFIDPDDAIDLNYYEELYKKAKDGDYDIVKCPRKNISIAGEESIGVVQSRIAKEGLYAFSYEWTTAIYKASIIKNNNIRFNDEIIKGQDVVFLNKIVINSKNIALIDNVHYSYFKREGSLHSEKLSDKKYISAIMALHMRLEDLNSIFNPDTSQKIKEYAIAYQYRFYPYFSTYYKTENAENRKLCMEYILKDWVNCKCKTEFEKLLRSGDGKYIVEYIKKQNGEIFCDKLNKFNSYDEFTEIAQQNSFVQNIFSVRNHKNHKVITILWFKIKLKLKKNGRRY